MLQIAGPLAISVGLVVLAALTAIAAVYFPDTRVDLATVRVQAARRRAWADPNEAARAAGIALLAVLLVASDLRRQMLLGAVPEDHDPAG